MSSRPVIAFVLATVVGSALLCGSGCPTETPSGPDSSWTVPDAAGAPDIDVAECTEDDDCRDGSFCGDDSACHINRCLRNLKSCPQGCDPWTGLCLRSECQANNECLEAHWCVDHDCVFREEACGEEGCPDGQTCEYDAETLSAECRD